MNSRIWFFLMNPGNRHIPGGAQTATASHWNWIWSVNHQTNERSLSANVSGRNRLILPRSSNPCKIKPAASIGLKAGMYDMHFLPVNHTPAAVSCIVSQQVM